MNGIDGRSLHMWRLAFERRAAPSAPANGPLVRGVVELVPRAETLSGGSARYVTHQRHRDDDERVTVHAP